MIVEAEYEEVETTGEELDLSEDDRLPWLEAEEDDSDAGALDTGQIIGFALILLTVLVLVVGGIWYYASSNGDAAIEPDGSTIAAPEGPIRERPEDPGGREVPGTGDVAPAVGEGRVREGVLDTGADAEPAGGEQARGADSGTGESSEGGESGSDAPATRTTGVAVQLAAYTSRERAEQGWRDLSRRTNALDGLRYRIERGVVDIGTVYRLQAVATDRAAADRLCTALRDDGLDCQVKP